MMRLFGVKLRQERFLRAWKKLGDTVQQVALNLGSLNAQVNCRGAKLGVKVRDKVNSFWKKKNKIHETFCMISCSLGTKQDVFE